MPGVTFVATTAERASATLTIEELGLSYRFVTVAPHKFFGHQRIWIEGQEIKITDRTKTVVDCLDHPEYCGGIVEAAKGLYESLAQADVSPHSLTKYADRMNNRTIFKRLGYLAELLDLPVGDELERWQAARSTGYSQLDPLSGDHGPYDSRWQLRLNRTADDLTDWLVH
jgi:predicted transcriptional regulator of viral defense system